MLIKSINWLNSCNLKLVWGLEKILLKRTRKFTLSACDKIPSEIYELKRYQKIGRLQNYSTLKINEAKDLYNSVVNNEPIDENNISKELVNWAIKYNISHVALSQLLEILNNNGLKQLPKCSKTILQAKENEIQIITVEPGDYIHYGIEKSLKKIILILNEKNLLTDSNISLSVFIDNLPLSKATNQGLWVILGSVIGFRNTIFLIGCYFGYAKPKNSNLFLEAFVSEVKNLCSNGLKVNEYVYNVALKRIVCDAPAKAFIMNIKTSTGYSSCTKCNALGEYNERKVCFPEKSNPRTDNDYKKLDLYKNEKTKLLEIPDFGLVSNIPIDYMHLVCLGVIKQLLSIWLEKKKYRKKEMAVFDDEPQNFPKEFQYKLKPLNQYKNWTPSQCRQFLLYYGPVQMKPILANLYYNHFLLLHVACRIFCITNSKKKLVNFGDELLNKFIREFKVLYGIEQITHNVHGLYHLADDYKLHGTLDNFSAFPFEKHLVQLRYSLKLSKKKSLLKKKFRQVEESLLNKSLNKLEKETVKVRNKLKSVNSKFQVEGKNCLQYQELKLVNSKIILKQKGDIYVLLKNGKIVEVLSIIKQKGKSSEELFIEGKEYRSISSYYEEPLQSSSLNIFLVNDLSEKSNLWPVKMINRKCMKVSSEDGKQIMCAMLDDDF